MAGDFLMENNLPSHATVRHIFTLYIFSAKFTIEICFFLFQL